ncbi:MAG: EndoU domain-containing protein [Acidobacteriota bacterium]
MHRRSSFFRAARAALAALVALALLGCGASAPEPAAAPDPPPSATADTSTQRAAAPRGWSATDPPIDLTHVFQGEVNRRSKVVGWHARPGGAAPEGARIVRISAGPNRLGVYTADIELYDAEDGRWEPKFSTFFPDDHSVDDVVDAILTAYRDARASNRIDDDGGFEGDSGRGYAVRGYLDRRGDRIRTAFPRYRRDR